MMLIFISFFIGFGCGIITVKGRKKRPEPHPDQSDKYMRDNYDIRRTLHYE